MLENCRVCCETTQGTSAKNLFDSKQSILLHHIELLTGEWLTNEKNAPTYICICCEQDLKVAAALRERCIKTQRKLREESICASPASGSFDEMKVEENSKDEGEHSESDQCAEDYVESDLDCAGEDEVDDEVNDSVDGDEDFDDIEDDDSFIIKSPDIKEESNQSTEEETNSIEEESQSIRGENELEAQRAAEKYKISTKQPVESPDRTSPESSIEIPVTAKRKNLNHRRVSTKEQKKRRERRRDCFCDQCGRHFTDLGNLKLHLIRHSGIKKYECEVCSAKFYSSNLLKRHSLKHTSTPPTFACKYCGKTFIYNNYRLRHEREHFKERRFHCDYCDKTFYNTTAKKDHELIHIGFREFHCELCDQHFLRKTHLRAHYRSKTHKNNEQQKK